VTKAGTIDGPRGSRVERPASAVADARPWHSQSVADVLAAMQTPAEGLSAAEAAKRLAAHGPNRLPEPPRAGPIARFLRQFHNLLIYVLLAAAAVTLLQFGFTYAPFMESLFDTRPIGILDGLLVVAMGPLLLALLELEKRVLRSLNASRPAAGQSG